MSGNLRKLQTWSTYIIWQMHKHTVCRHVKSISSLQNLPNHCYYFVGIIIYNCYMHSLTKEKKISMFYEYRISIHFPYGQFWDWPKLAVCLYKLSDILHVFNIWNDCTASGHEWNVQLFKMATQLVTLHHTSYLTWRQQVFGKVYNIVYLVFFSNRFRACPIHDPALLNLRAFADYITNPPPPLAVL